MRFLSKRVLFFVTIFILLPEMACYASGDVVGIPWKPIFFQVVNFSIVLLILGYLIRKKGRDYFAQRAVQFEELSAKTEKIAQEAEELKAKIQNRLALLKADFQKSLLDAERESENSARVMLDEAKETAARIKMEAEMTQKFEYLRAAEAFRVELLAKAIKASDAEIRNGVKAQDQKRLQTDFINNIQVVN